MTPDEVYDLKEEFLRQNPDYQDFPFEDILDAFCEMIAIRIEEDNDS